MHSLVQHAVAGGLATGASWVGQPAWADASRPLQNAHACHARGALASCAGCGWARSATPASASAWTCSKSEWTRGARARLATRAAPHTQASCVARGCVARGCWLGKPSCAGQRTCRAWPCRCRSGLGTLEMFAMVRWAVGAGGLGTRRDRIVSHSPAHMGPKRQQPFKGPLTEGNTASKKSKQLVAAGLCRECGSELGRAKTICDTCADKARVMAMRR